jgi:two-component system, chemotaxis family, protein-glutamate methylesterase/glutaminase
VSATGRSNDHADDALAVIVIGMSAGGLAAFRIVVCALPVNFAGAVVVAHHVADTSVLPMLVQSWTGHRAVFATEDTPLSCGGIYVCPAGHHVAINPDATLALSTRGRIAHVRPSVDWLFESAAATYGPRALAVVLSGANADGARGAARIVRAGGVVIVQAPETCAYREMPCAALAAVPSASPLAPVDMAPALIRHVTLVNAIHSDAWRAPFGVA